MTTITVYDTTAAIINKLATDNDTSAADVLERLIESRDYEELQEEM